MTDIGIAGFCLFLFWGFFASWLSKNWQRGHNSPGDSAGVEGSRAVWNHDSWRIRWDDFNKALLKDSLVSRDPSENMSENWFQSIFEMNFNSTRLCPKVKLEVKSNVLDIILILWSVLLLIFTFFYLGYFLRTTPPSYNLCDYVAFIHNSSKATS